MYSEALRTAMLPAGREDHIEAVQRVAHHYLSGCDMGMQILRIARYGAPLMSPPAPSPTPRSSKRYGMAFSHDDLHRQMRDQVEKAMVDACHSGDFVLPVGASSEELRAVLVGLYDQTITLDVSPRQKARVIGQMRRCLVTLERQERGELPLAQYSPPLLSQPSPAKESPLKGLPSHELPLKQLKPAVQPVPSYNEVQEQALCEAFADVLAGQSFTTPKDITPRMVVDFLDDVLADGMEISPKPSLAEIHQACRNIIRVVRSNIGEQQAATRSFGESAQPSGAARPKTQARAHAKQARKSYLSPRQITNARLAGVVVNRIERGSFELPPWISASDIRAFLQDMVQDRVLPSLFEGVDSERLELALAALRELEASMSSSRASSRAGFADDEDSEVGHPREAK